jgi:hypothetical protein
LKSNLMISPHSLQVRLKRRLINYRQRMSNAPSHPPPTAFE